MKIKDFGVPALTVVEQIDPGILQRAGEILPVGECCEADFFTRNLLDYPPEDDGDSLHPIILPIAKIALDHYEATHEFSADNIRVQVVNAFNMKVDTESWHRDRLLPSEPESPAASRSSCRTNR